jgi:GNAT superfamily N-acetyltransferase
MTNQKIILEDKILIFREISINDEAELLSLFNKCKDFFLLTEGVTPISCDSFFYDLPPKKNLKDKYLYGVFENSSLIAAIDVVSDYPKKGEWIIGLLLIHPKERKIGLGKRIHNIIEEIAKNKGAEKLRIGIVEQNAKVLGYWSKMGYKQIEITQPKKNGILESKVIIMNYKLIQN